MGTREWKSDSWLRTLMPAILAMAEPLGVSDS